jgi:putative addiction module component (TIGR02574 family)
MASLSNVNRDLSSFDQLDTGERIKLLQDLWDEIAAHPEHVPVTDAQRAELGRRLDDHRSNPDACVAWSEAKARLRSG